MPPLRRGWRLAGVLVVVWIVACVGGAWWTTPRLEPPEIADPSAWSDGRIRFSYPGNWRVEVDGVPSSQIEQVHLRDTTETRVLSIRTFEPAQVSGTETELDFALFQVTAAWRGVPGTDVSVTPHPDQGATREILGIRSTSASATARWSLLGTPIERMDVWLWELLAEGSDRSATVWLTLPHDAAATNGPGIELVLDTLAWAPPR